MLSRPSLPLALSLVSLVVAGPCDIYATGNTPCVAAHSTTRALYNSYDGALYEVLRNSDNTTTNISPVSAGGVAKSSVQDTFCKSTTCVITIIYDQSGNANHLTQAPPGGATAGPQSNGYDNLASAIGAPATLNGAKVYGVFISPGTGYRIDKTTHVATGNNPEGLYAVFDGTHWNDACCFDYGNAETSNTDTGPGHMEAIYFGNSTGWGTGSGNGPWIMVDMEDGLFSGENVKENTADTTITDRFLSAIVKGGADEWSIRGGNAASGALSTYYTGVRPNATGYNPMSKQGAIILGIGGDNSDGAQGTFYEGVMTSGYPTDATENSVQANIVAAKYATASLISGPAFTVGDSYSFRVTTPDYNARYIAHNGSDVVTSVVTSSSSTALKQQASWTVRDGLGCSGCGCYSFESVDTPGSYIRHYNYVLYVNPDTGEKQMAEDATFCPMAGLDGQGSSLRAWGYPTRYWRHYDDVGYIASNGGPEVFDSQTSFNDDVSFVAGTAFAS